jgi:circadian clock protein KaiB
MSQGSRGDCGLAESSFGVRRRRCDATISRSIPRRVRRSRRASCQRAHRLGATLAVRGEAFAPLVIPLDCSRGTFIKIEGFLSNYLLRLYVTGKTAKADVAIANLRRICEQELRGKYELQVIDVLEQPQMAEDEKILATPTLIKQLPPPLRRVIGDLSDKEKVLLGLEVFPDSLSPIEREKES